MPLQLSSLETKPLPSFVNYLALDLARQNMLAVLVIANMNNEGL